MLNVGSIAKTYGMLPSQVLATANTYDLMITDVMSSWEEYQYDKAMNKNPEKYVNEDDMMEMLRKARDGN